MARLINLAVLVVLFSLTVFVNGLAQTSPLRPFDEFGDTNCEDEMARLDNFAIQLLHEPQARGVIIFYGGKTFRGKLPRRGEAAARAARMKPYLVQRRGIPTQQVKVINGGYAEAWHVELWVFSPGASIPTANSTVQIKQIKFRKGKPNPRDYRCRI